MLPVWCVIIIATCTFFAGALVGVLAIYIVAHVWTRRHRDDT